MTGSDRQTPRRPVAAGIPAAVLVVLAIATAGPMAVAASSEAPPEERAAVADTILADHPALLAPLTPGSTFPRFSAAELAAAGFPDDLHRFSWPGFEPFVDPQTGETYGPRSLVTGRVVQEREGLENGPGFSRYRRFHLTYDPGYEAFHMLPMVEMLDWAHRDLSRLLGHALPDTLRLASPDNLDDYRERTGYAFHRLYQDQGDVVVLEPVPILVARTLAVHVAHHLIASRLLDDLAGGRPLPAWFRQGVPSYLAQEGTHLVNYLAMYRADRDVVVSADQVERVLTSPPLADDEADKFEYRRACYSAFLMAWELIEHRGGLAPVREFCARIGAGEDPDTVSEDLWGHDLADLAADLDATRRPEPIGDQTGPRSPHRPPSR
jgi:hypothetical protein